MENSPVIPFGEWLPDRPAVGNPGALVAQNVVPAEGVYEPYRALSLSSQGLSDVLAYQRLSVPGGADRYVAGTTAELHAGTKSLLTRQSSGFSASSWSFAQWGDEIIAVSEDGLWYAPVSGGEFTQEASAPGAQYVEVIGDFIVLGRITDNPNRIQWSGFNRRDIWGVDRANQADFNDMPYRFGAVTGVAGQQYNTIFQERAISRLTFTGGATVFRIDTFEEQKGCVAPGSVLSTSFSTFFVSQDGPNVWDGQTARPIASGKYRKWFADNADVTAIKAAIDWRHNVAAWFWPNGSGSQGILYSWEENRATEVLFDAPVDAITWDNDGPVAMSGGQVGTFTGDTLPAILDTGEFQPSPNRRAFVSHMHPVIAGQGRLLTGQLGKRSHREGDALTWTPAAPQQAESGKMSLRSSAQVHRARVTIPAGTEWTDAQGIQVGFRAEGAR